MHFTGHMHSAISKDTNSFEIAINMRSSHYAILSGYIAVPLNIAIPGVRIICDIVPLQDTLFHPFINNHMADCMNGLIRVQVDFGRIHGRLFLHIVDAAFQIGTAVFEAIFPALAGDSGPLVGVNDHIA